MKKKKMNKITQPEGQGTGAARAELEAVHSRPFSYLI